MSRIKLITFDATNTLFQVRNSIGQEYGKIGAIYGLKTDSAEAQQRISRAFKSQWLHINSIHPNFGVTSGLSCQQWWSLMVEKSLEEAGFSEGGNVTRPQLRQISAHLYRLYSTGTCWKVKDKVLSSLSSLAKRHPNVKLGVLSNFDERLEGILYQLNLRHSFHFVVGSYLAKQAKPDRVIFDLALEKAHLQNGSDALHVGDNIDLDYKAAKRAGWSSLLIRSQSQANEHEFNEIDSKEVISSLEEMTNHPLLIKQAVR